MEYLPQLILIGAVIGVGVLHTLVPDHWAPIMLLARQRGWSKAEVARAALLAGTGHVVSTLIIGMIVWLAGMALAMRFGALLSTVSGLLMIAFGVWMALSAWRVQHSAAARIHEQQRRHGGGVDEHAHQTDFSDDSLYLHLSGHAALTHIHLHRHRYGHTHTHWHDHDVDTGHPLSTDIAANPPLHRHCHRTTARTVLPLIVGSSPMVEGIPAFFAAGKYGAGLITAMTLLFAVSTMATYVFACVYSTVGLRHLRLGAIERYGEVLSGACIALVGLVFMILPIT